MRSRIPKTFLFVALMALAVVGCGSGDDETTSLTRAQFIKRADAICKKTDEVQLEAISKAVEEVPADKQSEAKQEEVVVTVGLPPIQKEAEEIGALGAPEGDEDEIDAIVTGIENAVKEAEDNPSAVLDEGQKSPFIAVDKLSAKYGFKACSEAL